MTRGTVKSYTEFASFDSTLLSIKIMNYICQLSFFHYYIFNINMEISIIVVGYIHNSSSTRIFGKGNGRFKRIRWISKCTKKQKENLNPKVKKQDLEIVGRMKREQKEAGLKLHICRYGSTVSSGNFYAIDIYRMSPKM